MSYFPVTQKVSILKFYFCKRKCKFAGFQSMFIDTVLGRLLCMVCTITFRGKSTESRDGISNLCLRFIAATFEISYHG